MPSRSDAQATPATRRGETVTTVTRRAFIGGGAVALAVTAPLTAHGQQATPAPSATAQASPAVSAAIDEGALLALSEALVGIGPLTADAVPVLAKLISADPALVAAYGELVEIPHVAAAGALDDVSGDARALSREILSFWYAGMFQGLPVPDRAALFAGLVAWRTVPYTTILTVCKSFGYWAQDVPVAFE